MRRFDKKKNIQKANLLAEQRHIKSNSLIREGINELNKSTYDSAADKARASGMDGLADKFATHGQEFGTGGHNISFTDSDGDPLILSDIKFRGDGKSFDGTLTSEYSKKKHMFVVSINNGKVMTYWGGDSIVYPTSVKDSKTYLTLLNDNGFDVEGIRPKQITNGYVNEMSEGVIEEVADNDSSMIISKIAKNIYSIAKNKGFNPSLSYDKGHGGMSGQISKGDNSKDEKGNEKPSLGILPLMNDNTIKLEVTSGIGWDKLGDNESRAKMEQTLDFFKNDLFPELFNHYKGLLEKEGINLTSKYEGATGFLIFNK